LTHKDPLKGVFREVLAMWRPPPELTLSQWADTYAYLSPESSHERGKWRSFPYQPGIMDAFTDLLVKKITVMKSARVGYTKILNWVVAYDIHLDPGPMLVVQPTLEDAQGYSKEEIAPMLRDVPVLQGVVSEAKSKDSSNTILKKLFPGGHLTIIGANSARGFRRISVRKVLFDEVDGYPATAGSEGDQIVLGSRRAAWFWDSKIVIGSTPTIKGISRVESSFEESDQRYFYVPCPLCGEFQILMWPQIKWPKGEPARAYYQCVPCGGKIHHSQKREMVEKGEWRATKPFNGHAGFHIWAAYSYAPNASWGLLAAEFLEAKSNPERLKTFVNTILGETWEDPGDRPPSIHELRKHCGTYKMQTVPTGAYMLTAGVDVQAASLVFIIVGFGKAEESWVVSWGELHGDPKRAEVWKMLDKVLFRSYQGENEQDYHIVSSAVDTGYLTHEVYNYCRKRGIRVIPVKGSNQAGQPIIGRPIKHDVTWDGVTIKDGIQLWRIGTDTAKATIYGRLKLEKPGPGYIHFPADIDDEFFYQLTAEKQITKYDKGNFPRTSWVKIRPRNEALDITIYALAAALRAGMTHMNLGEEAKAPPTPKAKTKAAGARNPTKGFKRPGWLTNR